MFKILAVAITLTMTTGAMAQEVETPTQKEQAVKSIAQIIVQMKQLTREMATEMKSFSEGIKSEVDRLEAEDEQD